MQKSTKNNAEVSRQLLLILIVCSLIAIFIFLPYQSGTKAGNGEKAIKDTSQTDKNLDRDLDNYDIRADKNESQTLLNFRHSKGINTSEIADARDDVAAAAFALRKRIPNLRLEYNELNLAPELIAPDVRQGRGSLSKPSFEKRPEILRGFLKQNKRLLGISDEQASRMKITADYSNPDENLSFTHFEQKINEIPVFQGEVKASFTKKGEIVRVVNNLAPGLDEEDLSADFGDPSEAVKFAASNIKHDLKPYETTFNKAISNDLKFVFGTGDWATTAEKMYFPIEPGIARPAWRVLIWEPTEAFYVIVDAETGAVLWRKNITEDQTQPATYSVYANPNSMINVANNPAPLIPGLNNPTLGTQGTLISRTELTLIGNEPPYTFNRLGWITDGNNTTDGNAVEVGLDRVAPDGIDPGSQAAGVNRVFNFAYTPAPGNGGVYDDPTTPEHQKGSLTQLFYINNRFHDEMFRLGFTEDAGNFQHINFRRGGLGNDRVSAQAQDIFCGSATCANNANFASPADGTRGRMQMFLWTNPNPDRDGALDAEIVIHEHMHGVSSRLHGNSTGLTSTMARGMGEGWSDFYAHSLLSSSTDPLEGIYTTGSYATYLGVSNYTANYYYGIRRFPKAIKSVTGPNGKPHNPLSFRHLNANCNAEIGSPTAIGTISAYPRGPYGSTICDQVHVTGEIWSTALWEVRAKFVQRLGWEIGNRRILQFVIDGMKLSPLNPTFLQARDSIIAAAQASDLSSADVADLWAGFAIRGMGFSAQIHNASPANVTEAFDLPNLSQSPALIISDSTENNNGFFEPGETLTLTVPLSNNSGNNADNVNLQLAGGEAVSYGSIANNSTVSRQISFTIPVNAPCGSSLTLTFNVTSSLGATSFIRQIIIGRPIITFTENFDSVTAPTLPTGWTTTQTGAGTLFVTTAATFDTAPNSVFTTDPSTIGGGAELTSPEISISAAAATISFRNKYDTEAGWDGGVLEISINGGAFQDILAAGGSFIEGGYNGTLGESTVNPVSGRQAWSGDSGGFINTRAQLPAAANGQKIKLRFRFGADSNTAEVGWNIDTVKVAGTYNCSSVSAATKARADFDGDGKTDISVFRPVEAAWYLSQSAAGSKKIIWSAAGDKPVPGDFDGDGITDTAVARPSANNSALIFRILNSGNSTATEITWGFSDDIPVIGDYDGDGKSDVAVFRPSNGTWYVLKSRDGFFAVQFGAAGDIPVPGDFDGDGKTDTAVFRPSNGVWYILNSQTGFTAAQFGFPTDKLVPADYDGDGKDDIAVFRPSNGFWYVLKSTGGVNSLQFGIATDTPVPGDYDGDGKDDIAVFRGGTWYLNRSTAGFTSVVFGDGSDLPIPKQYIP